jgi:hypothetical protein
VKPLSEDPLPTVDEIFQKMGDKKMVYKNRSLEGVPSDVNGKRRSIEEELHVGGTIVLLYNGANGVQTYSSSIPESDTSNITRI